MVGCEWRSPGNCAREKLEKKELKIKHAWLGFEKPWELCKTQTGKRKNRGVGMIG